MTASVFGLWRAFNLRMETILSAFWKKAGSALVMGAGISGMHYTGMAAAIFDPNSISTVSPQDINDVWLASAVGGFSLVFLAATLLISAFDAYRAERAVKHADSLRQAYSEIEARVAERTAGLARANQSLLEQIAERKAANERTRRYRGTWSKCRNPNARSCLGSFTTAWVRFSRRWSSTSTS